MARLNTASQFIAGLNRGSIVQPSALMQHFNLTYHQSMELLRNAVKTKASGMAIQG